MAFLPDNVLKIAFWIDTFFAIYCNITLFMVLDNISVVAKYLSKINDGYIIGYVNKKFSY